MRFQVSDVTDGLGATCHVCIARKALCPRLRPAAAPRTLLAQLCVHERCISIVVVTFLAVLLAGRQRCFTTDIFAAAA